MTIRSRGVGIRVGRLVVALLGLSFTVAADGQDFDGDRSNLVEVMDRSQRML